jgi:hypothetical protein
MLYKNLYFFIFLFCCVTLHLKAQTPEFRELTSDFASNKSFKAVGESVLRRPAGLNSLETLSASQKKKMKKKAFKDKNLPKDRNIIIYVDIKNINYPDRKGLYFVWGYEK